MSADLVYEPLKRDRQEIRLLDVQPAEHVGDPLRCILRHAPLSRAKFSALSYVWGPQKANRSDISITYQPSIRTYIKSRLKPGPGLLLTTQTVTIGSNLATALRCVRQNHGRITIWADALCINQRDLAEKSWQLKLMVLIYSRATMVLAWLGPSAGEDAAVSNHIIAAFKLAERVWPLAQKSMGARHLAQENVWLEACFDIVSTTSLAQQQQQQQQQDSRTQHIGADFAADLRKAVISDGVLLSGLLGAKVLAQMEYFSRIWILQETGRARGLTFYHGRRQIPYRPLFLALSLASSLGTLQGTDVIQAQLRGFDNRFLGCLTARTTCMQGRSFRDVLEVAYFDLPPLHRATDPKDLIYGRLGLARDAKGIEVDYRLSVPQVFVAAARFLLKKGFMDILITFRPYKSLEGVYTSELPSWAYDWSKKGLSIFSKYRASNVTNPHVSFLPYSNHPFQEALVIRGFDVGHVQNCGRRFSALVLDAGLSMGAVARGDLRGETGHTGLKSKQRIFTNITHTSQQLGTSSVDADSKEMSGRHNFPLASFWCWWLKWVLELQKLTSNSTLQDAGRRIPAADLAELLLRENHEILRTGFSIEDCVSTAAVLSAMVNWQRWSKLLFHPADQDPMRKTTELLLTALGIDVAENFFRAAWGMQSAVLRTGYVGYVPEATLPSDQVVIFAGVKAPLVIRKTTTGDAYRITGPAHIGGVMQGQLVSDESSLRTYTLI